MRTPSTRHRGSTVWLVVTPLLALVLVVVAVVALEAAAPEREADDLEVEGVPPLSMDEERSCVRRRGDTAAADVREEFRAGERVSSTQVHQCPEAFDQVAVTYVGEVVGELLPRSGGVWAQVNDDAYALEVGPLVGHRERAGFNTGLSVWLPDGLHEDIEGVGRPGRRGDVILVEGTLHRTDDDDGGGLTVRAETLDVLAVTEEVEDPLHLVQAGAAALLASLALGAVVWARRVRQR